MIEKYGYREIKHEIFQRIKNNQWGPGSQLPAEAELALEFGSSRATVNRAMQELSDDGIIERRRKGGSHVKLSPLRQVKFEMPLVRVEIEGRGATYQYKLISRELKNPPPKLIQKLNPAPLSTMLHIKCLHFANNKPYQFEDRWINLGAVPQAEGTDFSKISPNAWLVNEVPYTDVEMRLSALEANAIVAKHLNIKREKAVFVIERTTWASKIPVTHVHLYFKPSYEMIARY